MSAAVWIKTQSFSTHELCGDGLSVCLKDASVWELLWTYNFRLVYQVIVRSGTQDHNVW
jgi:hypothetical protein